MHAPGSAAGREGTARPTHGRLAARCGGAGERVHPIVSRRAGALRRRDRRRRGVRSAGRSGGAASRGGRDLQVGRRGEGDPAVNRWRPWRATLCAAAAGLVLCTAGLAAQTSGPRAAAPTASMPVPGSELDVTLMTFGLGEEVFERFGHNALWIHDGA